MSKRKKEEKKLFGSFFSKRVIDEINGISDDEIDEYEDNQTAKIELEKAIEAEREKNETQIITYQNSIQQLEENNLEMKEENNRLQEQLDALKKKYQQLLETSSKSIKGKDVLKSSSQRNFIYTEREILQVHRLLQEFQEEKNQLEFSLKRENVSNKEDFVVVFEEDE